jgi:hypothetical protein
LADEGISNQKETVMSVGKTDLLAYAGRNFSPKRKAEVRLSLRARRN